MMPLTPEQFVTSLRERDVELSVRNNRLRLDPGSAWRTLTADEVECLRLHRAAIKRLVEDEPAPKPGTEKTEPKPEPVVWTADYARRITSQDLHDAGVRGSTKAAYEKAREWLAKQDRERRANYATGVMFQSLARDRKGVHGGFRD